ncbi:MAG: trypsin-like peptidase domain-containing protein [Deltaproteobacteria bacterium]|nr:trypsin-like peptidase domain-containing protein [Deltaproteobacteria bacterium]
MKLCPKCDQPVAEGIATCPSCGAEIGEGRRYIDDYQIVDVLHEGYASFLCRAIRQRTGEMVMIRLFTARSGVTDEIAMRLKHELEELKKLPAEGFVRHYAIRQAPDGLWYRISEWLDTISWGSLLASGRLKDKRLVFDLFYQIASTLAVLHEMGYFIPHLILNDIILLRTPGEGAPGIKIDYKFSRFFDPRLDRPGPMLKKLLECHPDITNERPLDFRSDIWSLGKIFVEVLTADLGLRDFVAKLDELDLPREARILFKVMLAEDPDLRPQSMEEVAESLARIKEGVKDYGNMEEAPLHTGRGPRKLRTGTGKKVMIALALLLVAIIIFLFQQSRQGKDRSSLLEFYANRYTKSVAFLVVEYWLEWDGEKVYRNRSEGTAFLVDKEGYMLTSRHVVCPWLEDSSLFSAAEQLKKDDRVPKFDYRLLLWFEGTRAFNRAARFMEEAQLEDVYLTSTAYTRISRRRVSIAGIPKPLTRITQIVSSPFKDDFALLRIDPVPPGIAPLPLDPKMESRTIPKLTSIITLGFPLGSRTQEDTVNASVTRGNVRRSFQHLLQVDASIYGGSSGGPVVDTHGKVIGIVSGVATELPQGLLPIPTPRWDIGMVLPIKGAVEFLRDVKAGNTKWNGVLDFSLENKLQRIREHAGECRWNAAQGIAEWEIGGNPNPRLVTASGMMYFCRGDFQNARKRFSQSLSMDPENMEARFMLYLMDWMRGKKESSQHRAALMGLDWRSEYEFQGYLARVLGGSIDEDSALRGWYTSLEKSWILYLLGLKRSKRSDLVVAEKLLRDSLLSGDRENWGFYLALSELERVQELRQQTFQKESGSNRYRQEIADFTGRLIKEQEEKRKKKEKLLGFTEKLSNTEVGIKERIGILKEVYSLLPGSPNLLAALAFYHAADETWKDALVCTRSFLKRGGRSNSNQLSLGLLEPCIMYVQGNETGARSKLRAYVSFTRDPWYRGIARMLLEDGNEALLSKGALETPENLLTAYAFLGFWAEGIGDKEQALRHYRRALESFLDTWLEYDFIRERLKRLRKRY